MPDIVPCERLSSVHAGHFWPVIKGKSGAIWCPGVTPSQKHGVQTGAPRLCPECSMEFTDTHTMLKHMVWNHPKFEDDGIRALAYQIEEQP